MRVTWGLASSVYTCLCLYSQRWAEWNCLWQMNEKWSAPDNGGPHGNPNRQSRYLAAGSPVTPVNFYLSYIVLSNLAQNFRFEWIKTLYFFLYLFYLSIKFWIDFLDSCFLRCIKITFILWSITVEKLPNFKQNVFGEMFISYPW